MAQEMNLNAVLMKFIKLPPAVRIVLALAGFASLASIVTVLSGGSLRTRSGQLTLLVIGAIGLVIFGLIWAIRRYVFGKRAGALSGALESQGPSRGDVAEQEQIYRKKFLDKLKELKANDLHVYKLPWFILMGEPGCGKTASLIHSGLDFPLGKDEVPGFGGTRNYNWWFTNEAVILDTAGRIAFHEEGTTDKLEWEYFVKLLKKFRPRCPLNGVVIALPADKLLRDSSDERATKAAVLRERLRQIHQLLGVRFPTFVVVTKMDLVGGFNEFFEEIRADLQLRNQIFGWSRPGEFQTTYDPNTLEKAFDETYSRIRDWCMKYLRRNVPESELGMIVTFPESFRQLRSPLNDYIGTIFQKSPLLEPPFFRGFYFASAVQEGAPILDIFSRTRSGLSISERAPRTVDSKAFFIHDLYARKVFPEQGLVFRSAKHVALNRRMRGLALYGGVAMVAAMIGLFTFGWFNVDRLVTQPEADCQSARSQIVELAKPATSAPTFDLNRLRESITQAKKLGDHVSIYDAGWARWAATALFIGARISEPQQKVRDIHARYVLDCVVKPVLDETHARLVNVPLSVAPDDAGRIKHLDALCAYARWYGALHGEQRDALATDAGRADDFTKMLRFIHDLPEADALVGAAQAKVAFEGLAKGRPSFARNVLSAVRARILPPDEATAQLAKAVDGLANYWRPLTKLETRTDDKTVAYWVAFADKLGAVRARYNTLLGLRDQLSQPGGFEPAAQTFAQITRDIGVLDDFDTRPQTEDSLKAAWQAFHEFLKATPLVEPVLTPAKKIRRLSALLEENEKRWLGDFERVAAALREGAPSEASGPPKGVYDALTRAKVGLRSDFQKNLDVLIAKIGLQGQSDLLKELSDREMVEFYEAPDPPMEPSGPPYIRIHPNALGAKKELKSYLQELSREFGGGVDDATLSNLTRWPELLGISGEAVPTSGELGRWFKAVDELKEGKIEDRADKASNLKGFWTPNVLYQLTTTVRAANSGERFTDLLRRMSAKALETTTAPRWPGIARLMPGFQTPTLPYERFGAVAPAPTPAAPVATPAAPPPTEPTDVWSQLEAAKQASSSAPASAPTVATPAPVEPPPQDDRRLLTRYCEREFFGATLKTAADVLEKIKANKSKQAEELTAAIRRAADAYVNGYQSEWRRVHDDPTRLHSLALREAIRVVIDQNDSGLSWDKFKTLMTPELTTEIGARVEPLVTHAIRPFEVFDLRNPRDIEALSLARAGMTAKSSLSGDADFADLATPQSKYPEKFVQVSAAWKGYLSDVQRGDAAAFQTLQKTLNQAFPSNEMFVGPLRDLAAFGDELSKYASTSAFQRVISTATSAYPFNPAAGTIISPGGYEQLLKEIQKYRSESPKLSAEQEKLLQSIEAWSAILSPNAAIAVSVDVSDAYEEGGRFTQHKFVYTKYSLRLPLNCDQKEYVAESELPLTIQKSCELPAALASSGTILLKDVAADARNRGNFPESVTIASGITREQLLMAGLKKTPLLFEQSVLGNLLGVYVKITINTPAPTTVTVSGASGGSARPSAEKLRFWITPKPE